MLIAPSIEWVRPSFLMRCPDGEALDLEFWENVVTSILLLPGPQ